MGALKFKSAFVMQVFATLLIASLSFMSALVDTWVYSLPREEGNFNHRVTSAEMGMIQYTMTLATLVATPFTGYAISSISRKYSVITFGAMFVVTWALIFIIGMPAVIASVALAAVGFAGRTISMVYITEIVQNSFRGFLSSLVVFEYFIGLIFGNELGSLLRYRYPMLITNFGISLFCVIAILFLKESPVYLVQKGKIEEAAKSIAFYRSADVASKEVENEIENIKRQLNPRVENIEEEAELTADTKKLTDNSSDESVSNDISSFQFFRKSSSSKRAFGCMLFLVTARSLPLSMMTSDDVIASTCAVVGILLCAGVVDWLGRKILMQWTSVLLCIISVLLGLQSSLRIFPNWFEPVLAVLYFAGCYLGVGTVPIILTAEVFLPKVRGLCVAAIVFVMSITDFLVPVVVYYTTMRFDPLMFYIISVQCFITALYSHYYLPETKGLSADEIQPLFMKQGKIDNKSANKV